MASLNATGGETFFSYKPLNATVDFTRERRHQFALVEVNGRRISHYFLRHRKLDLGIPSASYGLFDGQASIAVGCSGREWQLDTLQQVAVWCGKYGVVLELSTAMKNTYVAEDMSAPIAALRRVWRKFFPVLVVRPRMTRIKRCGVGMFVRCQMEMSTAAAGDVDEGVSFLSRTA